MLGPRLDISLLDVYIRMNTHILYHSLLCADYVAVLQGVQCKVDGRRGLLNLDLLNRALEVCRHGES